MKIVPNSNLHTPHTLVHPRRHGLVCIVLCLALSASRHIPAAEPNGTHAPFMRAVRSLNGKPYRGGTLEAPGTERLIVNLAAFDCVTFVETVTAMSVCGLQTPDDTPCFRNHLQKMRYRNGIINGYASRLHYFAEWIIQNGRGSYYTDITRSLGGVPVRRTFALMSGNPSRYPRLSDKGVLHSIRKTEKHLSSKTFHFIPSERIPEIEDSLPPVSLVAFVSRREDILISHTGFALRINGTTRLVHASSSLKRVLTTDETLREYMKSHSRYAGIIVLEPAP
ncbi:MAG: N-acetylmuramoyl-L-alanine amidase-like domain-containing protein [Spirochaetota bacterium]